MTDITAKLLELRHNTRHDPELDRIISSARSAAKDAIMGPLPLSPPGRLLWITDVDDIPFALSFAIQYASRLKAQLKLLHARPIGNGVARPEQHPRAVEVLEGAAGAARAAGVECDCHIENSPLSVSLQNVTDEWSPDRILRVRSREAISEGLDHGTETILREAVVPVFVVARENVPAVFRYPAKILFPTSLDRHSLEVAGAVLRFAHAHGAEITMLHVIDGGNGPTSWTERVRACADVRFREVLEDLGGLEAETLTELGNVYDTVARIAHAEQHSLILLSVSSGISFRSDIRPGAAYKILCHAPCPVLVCKQNVLPPIYGSERPAQSLVGPLHLPPG